MRRSKRVLNIEYLTHVTFAQFWGREVPSRTSPQVVFVVVAKVAYSTNLQCVSHRIKPNLDVIRSEFFGSLLRSMLSSCSIMM
jgi:hypothetical protein